MSNSKKRKINYPQEKIANPIFIDKMSTSKNKYFVLQEDQHGNMPVIEQRKHEEDKEKEENEIGEKEKAEKEKSGEN